MVNGAEGTGLMAGRPRFRSNLQRELLGLLRRDDPRLAQQVSERIRPQLAEVGRTHAGRAAPEIVATLEAVIRSAGAQPDHAALEEFAEEISQGRNPFD